MIQENHQEAKDMISVREFDFDKNAELDVQTAKSTNLAAAFEKNFLNNSASAFVNNSTINHEKYLLMEKYVCLKKQRKGRAHVNILENFKDRENILKEDLKSTGNIIKDQKLSKNRKFDFRKKFGLIRNDLSSNSIDDNSKQIDVSDIREKVDELRDKNCFSNEQIGQNLLNNSSKNISKNSSFAAKGLKKIGQFTGNSRIMKRSYWNEY